MKQAYERHYDTDEWCALREIELLPKCKKVTEFGNTMSYRLVKRKVFFGLIPVTYWVNEKEIFWYDTPTVEYYDCEG